MWKKTTILNNIHMSVQKARKHSKTLVNTQVVSLKIQQKPECLRVNEKKVLEYE